MTYVLEKDKALLMGTYNICLHGEISNISRHSLIKSNEHAKYDSKICLHLPEV